MLHVTQHPRRTRRGSVRKCCVQPHLGKTLARFGTSFTLEYFLFDSWVFVSTSFGRATQEGLSLSQRTEDKHWSASLLLLFLVKDIQLKKGKVVRFIQGGSGQLGVWLCSAKLSWFVSNLSPLDSVIPIYFQVCMQGWPRPWTGFWKTLRVAFTQLATSWELKSQLRLKWRRKKTIRQSWDPHRYFSCY